MYIFLCQEDNEDKSYFARKQDHLHSSSSTTPGKQYIFHEKKMMVKKSGRVRSILAEIRMYGIRSKTIMRVFWVLLALFVFLRGWLLVMTDEAETWIDEEDDGYGKKSDTMKVLRSVSIVRFCSWIWQLSIQFSKSESIQVTGDCVLPPAIQESTVMPRQDVSFEKEWRFYVYNLGPELQPWLNESEEIGQQYSMGSIVYERLLQDPRRTVRPQKASLFFVPVDLSRFTFGDSKLEPDALCKKIQQVQDVVANVKVKYGISAHHSSSWNKKSFSSLSFQDHENTRGQTDEKKSLSQQIQYDHVVPVARVALSMYWGWGKFCPDKYEWLRRMQWLTIEPPYLIDKVVDEAYLDISDKAPSGGAFRHHMIPYPSGIRLNSAEEVRRLIQFQGWMNRTFLVAQILGDHERRGSTLRPHLKLACDRMATGICATDWLEARQKLRRKIRSQNIQDPFIAFAEKTLQKAPYFALYVSATFCIQPPGVTPSRAAIFQCLLAGGIPVFFEKFLYEALNPLFDRNIASASPLHTAAHNNETLSSPWAVIVSTKQTLANPFAEVYGRLARMPSDTVAQMQTTIANAAVRLQYAYPGSDISGDAYDYSLDAAYNTVPWCARPSSS